MFHLLFFALFILCCLINLRINTISKMSLIINSIISKTSRILKKFDDWNEWIMIIKTIIKQNDVEKYVNLIKIDFAEFIEFDFFIFFTIKLDTTNSINLSIDEQRDLAILREDYKKKIRKYKKWIDALKNFKHFHFDFSWSIQSHLFQKSEDDSSKIINFEETSRVDELSSKIRNDSQIQKLAKNAQTSTNESMIVKIK